MKKSVDFKEVAILVKKFAETLVEDLQTNLDAKDVFATGNLRQSISFKPLIINKSGIMFQLVMDSYYKYVDEGVKGRDNSTKAPGSSFQFHNKRPPIAPIKQWLINKGYKPNEEFISKSQKARLAEIKGINRKKSVLKKQLKKQTMSEIMDSFALATAINIQKNGLRATNFYSDVINEERFEKFRKEISEAFKQDIIISINK